MISLGLKAADQKTFHNLLVASHRIEIMVHLMTLSHAKLADISDMFLDGQVSIDWSTDITRSANLTFLDPKSKMALDSTSPADGAMFIDRMIQIYYIVTSPDQSFQVTVPVFCGPITKMDRDWKIVRIECMGKELLALDPVWNAKTYKKGALKTSVIRDLLTIVGETKFSLKSSTSKLAKNLAVGNDAKPWAVARSIANTMNYQLFYDGRGICVMRAYPTAPLWTFSEGSGGSILSKPQIGYDMSNTINSVIVKGATPKGKTSPITYRATAPKGHPLYPYSLGRGGKPRYISVEINDSGITSVSEARAVATDRLNRGMYEYTTAAFDILPIPHLEPHDPYKISTTEHSISTFIRQMTIPLVCDQSASLGYLRGQKPNATNIRKKR